MPSPDPPIDALLIDYERQHNLGLRSILSTLRTRGLRAEIVPYDPASEASVVEAALTLRSRLIGFSIIFQFWIDEMARLMRRLREAGVTAHFTAGGHFPSLRPAETLELLPDLDSVVRFEGELTLAEFLPHLDAPAAWDSTTGLAFRRDGRAVLTDLRSRVADLDMLPNLEHGEPIITPNGHRTASMLASRACLFNCGFSSIRQFYGSAGGARLRGSWPR